MDTIAITFPGVKVNAEIQNLTFDNLEDMIFEISQNIACRVFEKAITDIDNNLRKNRERGTLKNTGKRGKYFLTRFGDIFYTRTRYKDGDSKSHYLLDEALNMKKNQRISLSRTRIECFLSALSSYREVQEGIALLIDGPRCHEAIRQSVIKEGHLLGENQEKKLKQIENLNYPDKKIPVIAYLEADATYIKQQKKDKKDKGLLEVKLGMGYTGKEVRYASGKSKRVREKFIYTAIGQSGRKFMEKFSLLAEARFSLSKVKNILFGGDGDSWITSGIKDYFPSATYLLCFYHLFKKIKECLRRRKPEQKHLKDLLLSNRIDKALSIIDPLIRNPYDLKEKDQLTKLYTYIFRNRQGISNQIKQKDKAGAIESNVNQAIASRFKKRGMSWSRRGALALLKVKETILNNEWNIWWESERDRNIKVGKYHPPLSASHFKNTPETSPLIEVTLPAFYGPDQAKPWVGVLRKLTEVGYY